MVGRGYASTFLRWRSRSAGDIRPGFERMANSRCIPVPAAAHRTPAESTRLTSFVSLPRRLPPRLLALARGNPAGTARGLIVRSRFGWFAIV
ncbi:hypothetical protein AArcSl_0069 [Halalkaliarchaeum desulfuricum]|uniref:Uncharacterized protein n=1 Tax=Halalkaliarchaeum desulfuricum TaxID=2055893 RepID=A0A343TF55_9EURY|nr:hypothetical protein AArcSl_0069 [Halalkaliarchaeum desulfuricum]